ncbi:hypothetical protein [Acidithiobacillus sp.]|jgi:hypothetical protein|uniref:hypothetical protein n=1 Tax=Acidithiobacillus sp. TaxID=1872118 RepID=UPI0025C5337E|nr:hypothetical protein [Acidithiobacillus sp.]MCK9188947.1 hypothetical protein [Acidithiobacillus sp.]MCK9358268.1 hypothetical protein [Acidithiobacillus sp.]
MLNESSRLLLQQQFLEQLTGRTTIVHRGFPEPFLVSMAVADNDIGYALHQ